MFCQVFLFSGTVGSVGRNGWREERVGRALWGGILMGWCGQSCQGLARSSEHPDGHPGQADTSDPRGQSRGRSLQRACWRLPGQDGSTGELMPQEQPSPTQDGQRSVVIWPLPHSLSKCPLWDSTLIPPVVTCSSIHLLLFSFSLVSLSYYQNKTKTKLNKEKPRNYVYTNLCFRVCFGENQSWYGTEGTSSGMGQVDRLWSIQEAAWTRFTQQRARTGLRKRGCRSRLRNKSHP